MSAKSKPAAPRKRSEPKHPVSVLGQFHCDVVRYEFNVPIASFKTKQFSRKTGISQGDTWSAVLASDASQSGYHVHFSGSVGKDLIRARIEYWEGRVKRNQSHPEPSSESIMTWMGSFVREPSSRATAFATFEKPDGTWRSRFNLPFKVTMAGAEVVIDGVSLILPRNRFHAVNGWLTKLEDTVVASMDFSRSIEFASFDLADEVATFNESIKLIVEQA